MFPDEQKELYSLDVSICLLSRLAIVSVQSAREKYIRQLHFFPSSKF